MENKLILVFYACVKGFTQQKANEKVIAFTRYVENKTKDVDILYYIIPREGDNAVECLNPQTMDETDYKEIKEKLDSYKATMDEYFKKNEHESK